MDNTLDTPPSPNPDTISNNPLALRYGLMWAAAGIIMSLVGYLTDNDAGMPTTSMGVKAVFGLISLGIAFWAVIMAVKTDRDQNLGGTISLGRSVALGAKTGLVSGLVSGIFTALYVGVIQPNYAETLRQAAMAEYEKQGLSEEQIDMAMEMASKFMSPAFMGVTSIIGGVLIGLLAGLIGGALMKNR